MLLVTCLVRLLDTFMTSLLFILIDFPLVWYSVIKSRFTNTDRLGLINWQEGNRLANLPNDVAERIIFPSLRCTSV